MKQLSPHMLTTRLSTECGPLWQTMKATQGSLYVTKPKPRLRPWKKQWSLFFPISDQRAFFSVRSHRSHQKRCGQLGTNLFIGDHSAIVDVPEQTEIRGQADSRCTPGKSSHEHLTAAAWDSTEIRSTPAHRAAGCSDHQARFD